MSIYFSGSRSRSLGLVSAIGKQLKSVNLKGVKRITFTFDPFSENVKSIREFLFLLSSPKVQATNPKCVLKTDIVCNRQEPTVNVSLIETAQEKVKLKEIRLNSSNLQTLELLQLFNKHITTLAPPEDLTSTVATKAEKQKASGDRKIKRK